MRNNLFATGHKFEVVDPTDDTTYTVGSQGFMSYIEKTDSSFMNVAQLRTIMIRRGKGGKDRLSSVRIYVPIFTIDSGPFDKAMPDKVARKHFLHIKSLQNYSGSVMSMPGIDFLAWALSYVKKIKNMAESCQHHNLSMEKTHPFSQINRLGDYFEQEPEAYLEKYASEEFRNEFLGALRPFLSAMVRVQLNKAVQRAEMLVTAAEFLDFTNSGEFIPKDAKEQKNEYRFTEDEKSLKENIRNYKDLLKRVNKFSKEKSAKS